MNDGKYSFKNILTQRPDEVKGAVLTVLALLVLIDVISADEKVLAAAGIAIERLLSLFYVKPLVTSTAGLAAVRSAEEKAFEFGAAVAPVVQAENANVEVDVEPPAAIVTKKATPRKRAAKKAAAPVVPVDGP